MRRSLLHGNEKFRPRVCVASVVTLDLNKPVHLWRLFQSPRLRGIGRDDHHYDYREGSAAFQSPRLRGIGRDR